MRFYQGTLLTAITFVAVMGGAQVSRVADVKSSRSFIYHGKIVRPDGSSPTGSMSVNLKILSPDPKLCVLWSETQTVDMKEGGFSVELGHGVHRLPGASGGAAADFKQAFVNNSSLTISGAQCASGTSYTPSSADDRLLSATFNDAGSVIEVSGLPVKSVPYALQAEEVSGFGIANLMKIDGAGSALTYSPAEAQTLKDLLGGNMFFDMKSRAVKNLAAPVDPTDAATRAFVESHVAGAMSGAGLGTVTNVTAAGGALSVTNGSSTPQITLGAASAVASGYLTSADWNTFNGKQPAGAYLTAIPNLDASILTTGTVGVARGGTGLAPSMAEANKVYGVTAGGTAAEFKSITGTGTVSVSHSAGNILITGASGADNLGNHAATTNLDLAANKLVGNGGTEGIAIGATGNVGIGTTSPGYRLDVSGDVQIGDLYFKDIGTVSHAIWGNGARKLVLPGTGGNVPWRFYNNGGVGLEVINNDNARSMMNVSANTTYFYDNNFGTNRSIAISTTAGSFSIKASNEGGGAPGQPMTVQAGSGVTGYGAADGGDLTLLGGSSGDTGNVGNVIMATNGGNVGIGTASPATKLAVNGTTTSTKFQVSGTSASVWAHVGAPMISADTSVYSYGRICAGNGNGGCTSPGGVVLEGSGSNGYGNVYISGSGTSFFNGGSVGVGTTSPAAKLDVAGTIRAQAGTVGAACSPLGAQAYNSATGAPLYCSGSSVWTAVGGGTISCRVCITSDDGDTSCSAYSSSNTLQETANNYYGNVAGNSAGNANDQFRIGIQCQ